MTCSLFFFKRKSNPRKVSGVFLLFSSLFSVVHPARNFFLSLLLPALFLSQDSQAAALLVAGKSLHIETAATQDRAHKGQTGAGSATESGAGLEKRAGTEADDKKGDAPFNTVGMVMEHISDHHEWHLWGDHYIYLPVILYTDKGFEFFSSEKLEGHHPVYQGHYNYRIIEDKIKAVGADGKEDLAATKKILDFSITKNVASLLISVLLLLIIFIPVGAKYSRNRNKAPNGFQNVLEPLVILVRDEIAIPNLGRNYKRFMPFLLTLFFFIWINNVLGLLPLFPGGANLTGNIALTFTLAVITFLITNFNGKKAYWKHVFAPGVPVYLWPIMIPIEVLGLIIRPASLTIRLFANITAGHILVLSLIALIFIFKTAWIATAAVPFVLFISLIELLVGFIQAFIFATLASLYIGTALDDHHDH